MMKYFAITLLLVILPLSASAEEIVCPGNPAKLECMKTNFREFYSSNYEKFFESFNSHKRKAEKCITNKGTTAFLDFGSIVQGNAEVAEAFGEFQEKLFLNKPNCYLEAASKLEEEALSIVLRALSTPIFHDQNEISALISKYKNRPEFRRVIMTFGKGMQANQ